MLSDSSPRWMPLGPLLHKWKFRATRFPIPYRWTTRRLERLFADIQNIGSEPALNELYMGTLFSLSSNASKEGSFKPEMAEIVKGLEPVATAYILLTAVIAALEPDDPLRKPLSDGYVQPHFEPIAADEQSAVYLVLARRECEAFVEDWCKDRTVHELLGRVKNQLLFLHIELKEEALARQVFEMAQVERTFAEASR